MCFTFFLFSVCRETIARVTGGMKVKADRDEVGVEKMMDLGHYIRTYVCICVCLVSIHCHPFVYCSQLSDGHVCMHCPG